MITTKKTRINIGYQESYKVTISGKSCSIDPVAKEEINMELRKKAIERKKIICKEKILAKKMICGNTIRY